jgi:hypothetical protein
MEEVMKSSVILSVGAVLVAAVCSPLCAGDVLAEAYSTLGKPAVSDIQADEYKVVPSVENDSVPGSADAIKEMAAAARKISGGQSSKPLFYSEYSLRMTGEAPFSGTVFVTEGEMTEVQSGNITMLMYVTSLDAKNMMADVTLLRKEADGTTRLIARPKVLTTNGRTIELSVSDPLGRELYRLKLTLSALHLEQHAAAVK